jgi:hypothetical protein
MWNKGVFNITKKWFVSGLLPLAGAMGQVGWGAYGETRTIAVEPGAPIPPGWVIIGSGSRGPQFYTCRFPRVCYYTVLDLNGGGSYGETRTVLGYSPIPDGWVITKRFGTEVTSHYAIKYLITNVNGAGKGETIEILGIPDTPIPRGWAVTSKRSTGLKEYMNLIITNFNEPEATLAPAPE